ncbi:APC family permease [Malacoplasma iowae]|uniref:APC family permease n=1 Tax=Malacoplasma iowae TaxID=2116 RepID=UPI002A18E32C|nr:APC family permease [Malacoplasma iowae]WPL37692.1 APC family permease [Malacoplasma iowae]
MSTNNTQNSEPITVSTTVKSNTRVNKKQIGFLSVIIMVVSSTIGAGIFFKSSAVLSLSGGSIVLSTISWIIAAFCIVAIALALIEITSARKDDLSIIGWCKSFNGRTIYKACKNFMFYVYVPLTYFFMPLYVINSVQDAVSGFGGYLNFGTPNDWAIWMVISIAISLWFIILSGFSARAGKIQSWIIMSVKFLPLAVAALIGFIIVGLDNNVVNTNVQIKPDAGTNSSFYGLSPYLGMFAAISSIFFAFDGFYTAAGVQSEMKEPKKTPTALVIGLSLVTMVYLLISISMSIGTEGGTFSQLKDWFAKHNVSWIYGLINLFIGFGVLGIINGYAMWTPLFTEDLIKMNELPFSSKYVKYIGKNKFPLVGIVYSIIISIPVIIIFCTIGGLGYLPNGYASFVDGKWVSSYDGPGYISTAKLITFADLMSNWTTVGVFGFIAVSILGGIINRRRKDNDPKKVKTLENRLFPIFSWIAVIMVFISLSLEVLRPIIDLILLVNVKDDFDTELIGRIMLFMTLLIFLGGTFIPEFITDIIKRKKGINVKKEYIEEWEKDKQLNQYSE